MRSSLLLSVALSALVGCANPVPSSKSSKAVTGKSAGQSLSVGDPAPAWKATTWLNGEAVEKAEAGKVYVLEFWATWCGPCIQVMPHLTELQAKYKDQGLVVIGMTGPDSNGNDLDQVTRFAEKMGPKMGYLVAFDTTGTTYRNYMLAAAQRGIPCSFVIDRTGKVAYIGHPARLDEVLPKVLAGE